METSTLLAVIQGATGLVIALIGYIFNRYVQQTDKRIERLESLMISNQEQIKLVEQRETLIEQRNLEKFGELNVRLDGMDKKLDQLLSR